MNHKKRVLIAAFALGLNMSATAGAWGEGPFDNDDAQDWLIECSKGAGSTSMVQAIDGALRGGYVEADAGAVAVAAAAVIASVDGLGPPKPSAEAATCLAKARVADAQALVPRARQALERVANPKLSELAQLWAEAKPNKWAADVAALSKRLKR